MLDMLLGFTRSLVDSIDPGHNHEPETRRADVLLDDANQQLSG